MSHDEIWLRATELYKKHGLSGENCALLQANRARATNDALADDWLAVASRIKIVATLR